MPRITKILAPTDCSELSVLGLRRALEIARDACAEVIVYRAVDFGANWHNRRVDCGSNRDLLEESRQILDKFLTKNCADCIDLAKARRVVEFAAPDKSIVEMAVSEGVDMIVMSTHGRTGLDHFILGSVAEKIVGQAPCPVLIVPRPRRRKTDREGGLTKAASFMLDGNVV